jgi:hypothetical protein
LIFMLSRHQLADELYRERLAQARSRPQPPEADLRRAGPRRVLRQVLQLAAATRGLILPRTQAGLMMPARCGLKEIGNMLNRVSSGRCWPTTWCPRR